jgi:nucleotide-binding universal stress UspA family protein
MFKHILVPTDGSGLSARAAKAAAELARVSNARITAVHAVAPYYSPPSAEAAVLLPQLSQQEYEQAAEAHARKMLHVIEAQAEEAGVPCESLVVTSEHPWQAIVDEAAKRHCDLIAMASHGRRGLAGLLLGSETHKVLTHSKVPVFVLR